MSVYIPLLVLLLALSAFFSSAETAFLSLEQVRLEHATREGVNGAQRIARLLGTPRRLLSAILLGNNLVNTGAAAVGTVIAAEVVGSSGVGVLAATLVVTALLVVIGEVIPKTFALHHNFALSRVYAPLLVGWSRLTTPFVAILDGIARTLLSLTGEGTQHGSSLSLGELRTAIRMGGEAGSLEAGETSMLLGALGLQQRHVRHIMTPRVNMILADAGEPIHAVAEQIAGAGYLRLPVFADNRENVVGYVHVSDMVQAFIHNRSDQPVREIMREATFDSERASVTQVLQTMQRQGTHLTILVNEFGTISGLVTLEDVIEEVVGHIQSESGPQRGDVTLRIGGRLYVEGQRPPQ